MRAFGAKTQKRQEEGIALLAGLAMDFGIGGCRRRVPVGALFFLPVVFSWI
jgi:hypothetical protein